MDLQIDAIKDGGDEAPVKSLRIGFIGCGGIAQQHIAYFKKMAGVSIVCGADIRPAALEQMKTKHGVENVYEDYNVMLREMGDKVDAAGGSGY